MIRIYTSVTKCIFTLRSSGVETEIIGSSIHGIDLDQEIPNVGMTETEGMAGKRAGTSATGTGTVKGIEEGAGQETGEGVGQETGEGVGHETEDMAEVAIEACHP